MPEPWQLAAPERLSELKHQLRKRYPTLHVHIEKDFVHVRGSFPLEHEKGMVDRYMIDIELPADYPESVPVLRETGGRIPWIDDRHVNGNGVACPFLEDERWRAYPRGSTLIDYLTGPAHNFFLGQSLFELGEPWPFGERKHGLDGVIEYYMEQCETSNPATVVRYLRVLSRSALKGHWPCPCRSGRIIRHCHFVQLQVFRSRTPQAIASKRLGELEAAVEKARVRPSGM